MKPQPILRGRKALLAAVAAAQTEKEFAQEVVDYAEARRWLVYRTYDSRHSPAGYPDLTMARGARLVFAELKAEKGRTTGAQDHWLAVLRGTVGTSVLGRAFPEVYLWRPSMIDDIMEILR